jgi:hypothetical protein
VIFAPTLWALQEHGDPFIPVYIEYALTEDVVGNAVDLDRFHLSLLLCGTA